MKINGITLIFVIAFGFTGYYEVGDTVSSHHQRITYPVCYGSFPNAYLTLEDINGFENGGDYKVIWIEMLASW